MPTKDTARATKGLQRLAMWPLTADDETSLTYGGVHEFLKRIISAADAPAVNQANLDADNQTVEEVSERTGGSLTLDLTDITTEERVLLFAETDKNGTSVANMADNSGYVAVAYMTNRPDGLVNLYKFLKVKFAPGSETKTTKKKSGIEFATVSITGNYIPTIHTGDIVAVRRAVDPVADKEIVTNWFTKGDYIGPEDEAAAAVNTDVAENTTTEGEEEPQG